MNLLDCRQFLYAALDATHGCRDSYDKPNYVNGNAQMRYSIEPVNGNPARVNVQMSIAGTNDKRDVLADIKVFNKMDLEDGIKVHRGFMDYADLLQYEITKIIADTADSGKSIDLITIEGHSLGAAAAAIIGARSSILKHHPCRMFLFGCPRPGNAAFREHLADNFNGRVYNFYNKGDQVWTRMPAMLGYRHVGQQLTIGTGFDMYFDHPINAYIRGINEQLRSL